MKRYRKHWLVLTIIYCSVLVVSAAGQSNPFADLEAPASVSADPFSDLEKIPPQAKKGSGTSPLTLHQTPEQHSITADAPRSRNTFFKNEILSQVSVSSDRNSGTIKPYQKHSYGFELLKKFSNRVSTTSSFDVQARLVFRNQFLPVLNDMEGETRENWFLEYHNVYLDLYNALDSWMAPEARAKNLGRYNFRFGRFYLPFGLNLQTDTHGTILQLSNDRNFGFERDWYAGFWGSLDKNLNYDLYYLLGSGYDLSRKGQKGLIGGRLSLSNRFLYDHGVEAGFSVLSGERLSKHAVMRSHSVMKSARKGRIIDTLRIGLDGRYGKAVRGGKMTATGELSTGKDESDQIFTQLYQLEFLRSDRTFGWATQYRRFRQEIGPSAMAPNARLPGKTDASLIGELTWYMKNDIGNSNLEWIKVNVEQKVLTQVEPRETITTIQYYRYW